MTDIRVPTAARADVDRDGLIERMAAVVDPGLDDRERNRRIHDALGLLDGPALLVDLDGTVLDANEALDRLAIDPTTVRGRALWAIDVWGVPDPAVALGPLIDAGGSGRRDSLTLDLAAGGEPVRLEMTPIVAEGEAVLLLTELQPLGDRRESDDLIAETTRRLVAAEDTFRAVAEYSSDLVCLHQPDGTLTYVSPSARRLLERQPADLVGTHLVDLAQPDTRATLVNAFRDAARRGSEPTRVRYRVRHRSGSDRWFETAITPIRDAGDQLRQLQSSSRDITEQHQTEQSLLKQAFHDGLTGLPNKTLLLDRMSQALATSRRTGNATGVLFLDLDGFTTINDTLGRPVGDIALSKVAERLIAIVRPGDTLARVGGDEFVMLCTGTDGARGASIVARRVLDAFHRPFTLDGREVRLAASIGIATSDGDDGAHDVLDQAGTAMYEAKHGGRNRYAIHDETEHNLDLLRNDMETALRSAIDNDELRLHYQPELDLESGRIVGFEALVRWRHPDGRLVPPDEFIPLAEESGLIVDIGRWVIDEACRQAARWRVHRSPDQEPVRIWVNLSARQLDDPQLVAFVEDAVARAGVSTDEICMEITESALMSDADSATVQLDRLRRLGISLGIDDFGTGYSQFEYLHRLPLDVLKIDRTFVDGLGSDTDAGVIVSAIIDLAHALGLIVIAEGVENPAQLEALAELGCDQAVGFYFSEPREAAAFDQTLART